ncbi:zinc-dependent metalloprotease [Marinoscillum pacificum]|uniref:zinc-dependent metalloprotease n=1 Tax=Marinoscillum pacificum TaxID=392723 RepID=UPI0021583E00|nr:zinc-dependent metalloprotease [Marinoscillum pacificum]
MKLSRRYVFAIVLAVSSCLQGNGQNVYCGYENFLNRYQLSEQELTDSNQRNVGYFSEKFQYIIPTVIHVFHDSTAGKLSEAQVLSGLEILNNDFAGLNDGWETISPEFDSIKSTLNIRFVLAKVDPNGEFTTGIVYHEDPDLVISEKRPFEYAWDNFKYFNIYLPKYVYEPGSNFSGYTSYPSEYVSTIGEDGIVLSSVRWGFGDQSDLEIGDDWASINTHEAGHWLNLRHTFTGGCDDGDLVDDTPPTLGGSIELEGCENNDFSCGVKVNGENFMDYNHRCKKMFTKGQVRRMLDALQGPARHPIWQEENLVATGLGDYWIEPLNIASSKPIIYPNPAYENVKITCETPSKLKIYSFSGNIVLDQSLKKGENNVDITSLKFGTYLYQITGGNTFQTGKLLLSK